MICILKRPLGQQSQERMRRATARCEELSRRPVALGQMNDSRAWVEGLAVEAEIGDCSDTYIGGISGSA